MIFRSIILTIFGLMLLVSNNANAFCNVFTGSTMQVQGVTPVKWRQDFPRTIPSVRNNTKLAKQLYPWRKFDYDSNPKEYMHAVLSKVIPDFSRKNDRLVSTGSEKWWITPWLDVGTSGREPIMGLTRERGPDKGDLSETSSDGSQVWAVGFYNTPGAFTLGEIFDDKCNPSLPVNVRFPDDTVAIKFLFTDAKPEEVNYLKTGPEYLAMIDNPPKTLNNQGKEIFSTVENRISRKVRLLQFDIAVKDRRARSTTDWVFGTFAWIGPLKGDGLFDNLVPVSLQWGNDPNIYDENLSESWINKDLEGTLFGWDARPTLGFKGRANGPADNIRSSCLSCHAATGRIPRSSHGLVGNIRIKEFNNADKVKKHVDLWFDNINSREIFAPEQPYYSSLDYSLQLDAAMFRMCSACRTGALSGSTPLVCKRAGFYNRTNCHVIPNNSFQEIMSKPANQMNTAEKLEKEMIEKALDMPPPRQ